MAQRVDVLSLFESALCSFEDTLLALLHKSAIGQGIPNPKKIYAAATVWGVPRAVN